MTTRAAYLPPTEADDLRRTDRIQQGKRGVFQGYTSFKQFVWLTLPALLLAQAAVVAYVIRIHGSASSEDEHETRTVLSKGWSDRGFNPRESEEEHRTPIASLKASIQAYLSPPLHVQRESPQTYVYAQSFKVHLVFIVLGLCAMLLSVLSKSVFECADPMVRTTIAIYLVPVHPTVQWCQVLLSAASLWTVNVIIELLRRNDPETRAQCVYHCLLEMATDSEASNTSRHLSTWRTNAGFKPTWNHSRAGAWRRALFFLLHVPILVAASLPSIGFVRKLCTP